MEVQDFLLEIGVEEIPASYISPAMQKLQTALTAQLRDAKLSYARLDTYSTPRRFALVLQGLQKKQQDEIIERVGPSKAMAYDAAGNLTKAAQGFLRSAKASPDDIVIKDTPKGEKIALRMQRIGQPAAQLLPTFIKKAVETISFPKTMRWDLMQTSFARPVRWIVAMLDADVIPVSLFGITAGATTYGNRYANLENSTTIASVHDYEAALGRVLVIAHREKRKESIRSQIDALFASRTDAVIPDERLLDVVTDLVEFPTAVIGTFDKRYLELPSKIIVSTLSQHQKYFAIQDAAGHLVNGFVFISNGDPAHSELIRRGNEKVITARLEDAEFYFKQDTSIPLADFVPRLADVTFQAQLGSLLEKTTRVKAITASMLDEMKAEEQLREDALRTAYLCKADLVTGMLGEKEFTKLQGYIGMNYARSSGENPQVCQGIYEHYMPRGQKDSLPRSVVGMLVAVADKLDTVCGIIGVGLIPTGSADPFALRRAANGVVQILDALPWAIDIQKLIDVAFTLLAPKLPEENANRSVVIDFFQQRIEWLLKNAGIEYDVIASVVHMPYRDISDLKRRGLDVQTFKQRDDFIKLVLGFKRVSNIIADVRSGGEVNESLLVEPAEQALYAELGQLRSRIQPKLNARKYAEVMEELVQFGAVIDRFFDDVLVNVEAEEVRKNRYALLAEIRRLFLHVADLAQIVISENNVK